MFMNIGKTRSSQVIDVHNQRLSCGNMLVAIIAVGVCTLQVLIRNNHIIQVHSTVSGNLQHKFMAQLTSY